VTSLVSDNQDPNPNPPTDNQRNPGLRASNAERESALRILATHFADGRLDRAEFDERTDAALAARTQDQLRTLFADLPGPTPVPPAVPEHARAAASASAAADPAGWQARPPAPWTGSLVLVPVLLAFAVLAALHGAPPFPLIPLAFILLRRRRRSTRWNREVRPWT
jgi:uncharacterized protein DUF1707